MLQTANSDSTLYVAVAADSHPEVATCEKAIKDMLAHEQKRREDEAQRQREKIQARADKLLAKLRAAREKVRIYINDVYVYVNSHSSLIPSILIF